METMGVKTKVRNGGYGGRGTEAALGAEIWDAKENLSWPALNNYLSPVNGGREKNGIQKTEESNKGGGRRSRLSENGPRWLDVNGPKNGGGCPRVAGSSCN
jgi:hypothetical protein